MSYLTDPAAILAVLFFNVVLTEWLCRNTFLRHFGTALLVILITAVVSNLGIIPARPSETPVYGGIFAFVAPLAIFLPLLQVNLRDVLRAGGPMLAAFALGATGTVLGVLAGLWTADAEAAFGNDYRALAGMFAGTYIGGGVNFNALALEYGIAEDGILFAGSTAVDNILTALWMMATIAAPRLLIRYYPRRRQESQATSAPHLQGDADQESLNPGNLALLLGMGGAAIWLSNLTADWMAGMGYPLPSIVVLTTLALILGQLQVINRLPGTRALGMLAIYLFLAVIGAFCDLTAFDEIGELGFSLFIFAATIVLVHGLVIFLLGGLFKIDWEVLAIASQANVGGAPSALALARSLGRSDMVLASVLIGTLGYGVGTYIGFLVAGYLV
ncbi:MAG TPA: DUF819 family protein [Acidobacteriota bacterium]|nr:DUF819 family protein [Acidobacteriota bacterium]